MTVSKESAFSAIALVRKRSLKNAHLQNERSNLIFSVILLVENILQVVNAVTKIRKCLIVISTHKEKKIFFPPKIDNESRNLTEPNLIVGFLVSIQYFFVFWILLNDNVSSSLCCSSKCSDVHCMLCCFPNF